MPERATMKKLRTEAPVVLPSLLLCDFGHLGREITALEQAGVKALHLDVMDGVFVPNLTYGFPIVEACRKLTSLPIDVHLMITEPERYVAEFVRCGADSITIHVEATADPRPVLTQIQQLGASAALALNPPTPVSRITPYLDACDMVLVMSVMPGFGGQAFDPVALDKLRELRTLTGPGFPLEIDGGINHQTIAASSAAGADLFVVGSAIFRTPDYRQSVATLTELAHRSNT